MFNKFFAGKLSVRWPSQCRVCHTWPAQPVCEACVAQFGQPQTRCMSCAVPLPSGISHCGMCVKNPPPIERCLAAVNYAYPWSGLIQDFKFHAQTGLARSLVELLQASAWVEPALENADLVLPLPLSAKRLQARGYNQALLLAKRLCPAKTRADLLLRLKDTVPQHQLKKADRLAMMRDVYVVEPLLASQVKAKRVVLVDDVMTTGATLFDAARALKAAGARHITALVVARTE